MARQGDVAARLGLGVAVQYLLDLGPDLVYRAIAALAARLRAGLAELPRVQLRDLGVEQSGIVSFTVTGVDPDQVRDRLRDAQITVTVSRASSTRLDMRRRGLPAVVRASPHCFVTSDDVDRFCRTVARM